MDGELIYDSLVAHASRFGGCGELADVAANKLWLEKNPLIKKIKREKIDFFHPENNSIIQNHGFLIVNDTYLVDAWAPLELQLIDLSEISLVSHIRELLNNGLKEFKGAPSISADAIVKSNVIYELEGDILANFPEWALTARVELYPVFYW